MHGEQTTAAFGPHHWFAPCSAYVDTRTSCTPHPSHSPDQVDQVVELLRLQTLGWRTPPTDNSTLGSVAVGGEPAVEQLFVSSQNPATTQVPLALPLAAAE